MKIHQVAFLELCSFFLTKEFSNSQLDQIIKGLQPRRGKKCFQVGNIISPTLQPFEILNSMMECLNGIFNLTSLILALWLYFILTFNFVLHFYYNTGTYNILQYWNVPR